MTKEELYNMTLQQRAEMFDNLLLSTNRNGIRKVIDYLRTTDFYTCPASTKYHGNFDGGLLLHSLLVYATAEAMFHSLSAISNNIFGKVTKENIIISALLHDVCKINTYQKANRNEKVNGQWRVVESYDYLDEFPFGHGEKSVLLLSMCNLEMTPDEMLSIRWHMGDMDLPYGQAQKTYLTAQNICPLMSLIASADEMSAHLIEDTVEPRIV